jgi:hypothetical protein
MIYKYSFSVLGDSFYPELILNNIQGDFIIESFISPTDRKFENKPDEYGYGNLSFWHKNKFSTEDEILKYEKDFIEFIGKNHSLFVENGVTESEVFIEIYFDGGQCNFEIFNKELLKHIGDFEVSLPISVYLLKSEEINKWESEIKLKWRTN